MVERRFDKREQELSELALNCILARSMSISN